MGSVGGLLSVFLYTFAILHVLENSVLKHERLCVIFIHHSSKIGLPLSMPASALLKLFFPKRKHHLMELPVKA